ncbi:MAG: bifunctional ornithine acetyltransferase/N-acetylglutamate synthase, partial [Bifidobacterium sp.]|nr:bifunctional ornithine acetyltransferase/N-acetylglutamate synthase [Bifidobacterium sp.]
MSITYPAGFQTGTAIAHRPGGSQRRNLALVVNSGPMDTAVGVFTPNRFRAAPVVWTSRILEEGRAGAVV